MDYYLLLLRSMMMTIGSLMKISGFNFTKKVTQIQYQSLTLPNLKVGILKLL